MVNHCKKCNKDYAKESTFCDNCGSKLLNTEHMKNTKGKWLVWEGMALGILLIVSSIVVFAIPFPYSAIEEYIINEPSTSTEYYTQKEPYTDTISYTEKEPYTITECQKKDALYKLELGTAVSSCLKEECASYSQVCIKKNFWGNCIEFQDECESIKCIKYNSECTLNIENKEKETLSFNLELYKYDYDDKKETLVNTKSIVLAGLDNQAINWEYSYLSTESTVCWYKITNNPQTQECSQVIKFKEIQKTKEETKYKVVTKSQDVTKYQEVVKTRSVTKYATLFQRWTKKVQWYYTV